MFEELKNKGESLRKDAILLNSDFDNGFWKGYLKGLEEAEKYIKNGNKSTWHKEVSDDLIKENERLRKEIVWLEKSKKEELGN